MALKLTALVPAVMALGYLILVMYFAAKGATNKKCSTARSRTANGTPAASRRRSSDVSPARSCGHCSLESGPPSLGRRPWFFVNGSSDAHQLGLALSVHPCRGDARRGGRAFDVFGPEPRIGRGGRADTRIDLEVTSNRPDCLSHIGVAREVAALFGGTVVNRSPIRRRPAPT